MLKFRWPAARASRACWSSSCDVLGTCAARPDASGARLDRFGAEHAEMHAGDAVAATRTMWIAVVAGLEPGAAAKSSYSSMPANWCLVEMDRRRGALVARLR